MTQKTKGITKVKNHKTVLEFPLKGQEIAKLEKESVELLRSIKTLKAHKKKVTSGIDKQIREQEKQVNANLEAAECGSQAREVEANLVIDHSAGVVEFYFEGICRKAISIYEFKNEHAKRSPNLSDDCQLGFESGKKGSDQS